MSYSIANFNWVLSIISIVLCVYMIAVVQVVKSMDKRIRGIEMMILISLIGIAVCWEGGMMLNGKEGAILRVAHLMLTAGEFMYTILLCIFFSLQLLQLVDPDRQCIQQRRALNVFYSVVLAATLIFSYTGVYFRIDEANRYSRAPHFWISILMAAVLIFGDAMILILRKDRLSTRMKMALWIGFSVAFIALPMTQKFYGVYFGLMAGTLAAAIFLLFLMLDKSEQDARRFKETEAVRHAIVLSQVQPHFLYNALDSIYYLCGSDPKMAQQAVSWFSDYLRMNLHSFTNTAPVPFSTERRHVETYLELEKMSTGDALQYRFDCETENFLLPALTVQPLVENAVRHGILKKEEGGTVVISTRALEDRTVITIEDDGVGFDPEAPLKDGKTHIGIQNVRARIEAMFGGTLEIQSEPGKGTVVTVTLYQDRAKPREDPLIPGSYRK